MSDESQIPSTTVGYFFREALRRIWVSKRTSFVAVAMIAISLLIVGLFLLLSENLSRAVIVAQGKSRVEVYLATPLELCEARDVKGLYALARAGRLANLTGVDDPYEPPLEPEIVIDTTGRTVDVSLTQLWGALIRLPRRST